MVLVYANSKERAMHLAVLLDSVVLSNTVKVLPYNYYQLHDQLEAVMERDGYVRSFFRGIPHIFVYTDGPIRAPFKMVDYDPEYKHLDARPIPFFPSPFQTQVVDETFGERLEMYQTMCADADAFVNAATDDEAGELAYLYFKQTIGIEKPAARARPRAMTQQAVIENFNALQDENWWMDYIVASRFSARFRWLFSCNATNALSTHNYERKLMPVGHIESCILNIIGKRDKDIEAAQQRPRYSLSFRLTKEDGSPVGVDCLTPSEWSGMPKEAAQKTMDIVSRYGVATVVNSSQTITEKHAMLPSIFALQANAGEYMEKTTRDIVTLAMELYEHGLITWPSQSSNMPWEMKPYLANALAAATTRPEYANIIQPQDIDAFPDWAKTEDPFKRWGIVVTEQAPDASLLSQEAMFLYQWIIGENVNAFKSNFVTVARKLTLAFGDKGKEKAVFFSAPVFSLDRGKLPNLGTSLPHKGDRILIESVEVVQDAAPDPYTEWQVVRDMATIFEDGFCEGADTFSSAIETLILWGHVSRDDRFHLHLTSKGKLVYKYLKETSLSDIGEAISWNQRLLRIAAGTGDAMAFKSGMNDYITDICEELTSAGDEITETGGVAFGDLECPLCHGEIAADGEGGWSCLSCRFHIGPQLFGHTMSKLDIVELLTKGRTRLIPDFSSSKGTYSARLVLEGSKVVRSFLSPYPCPYCGGAMAEYSWGVKCKGPACAFALNTVVCGHTFTQKEMETLMARQMTQNLELVNSSGKKFVAALYLGEDKTLKFQFPSKKGKSV